MYDSYNFLGFSKQLNDLTRVVCCSYSYNLSRRLRVGYRSGCSTLQRTLDGFSVNVGNVERQIDGSWRLAASLATILDMPLNNNTALHIGIHTSTPASCKLHTPLDWMVQWKATENVNFKAFFRLSCLKRVWWLLPSCIWDTSSKYIVISI